MKRKIQKRVCDECGVEAECEEGLYGGTPFFGWFEIILTTGTKTATRRHYDICSVKCLLNHFTTGLDEKEKTNG